MNNKKFLYTIIPVSVILGLVIALINYTSPNDINDTNISHDDLLIESGEEQNSGEDIQEVIDIPTATPLVYDSIKAVYSSGWVAGSDSSRKSMIDNMLAHNFNAVVLDIKDEAGHLSYNSKVQTAIDVRASQNMIKDIDKVIKDYHDNGIYVIGRIVTFKDPTYAKVVPNIAYLKADGTSWKDSSGNLWPNPCNTTSWEYPIALAKEAAELGFDEIQFDYIRFPSSEGKTSLIAYNFTENMPDKSSVINSFLTRVMDEMADYKIKISADVFGITTKRDGDFEKIGQNFRAIADIVDVICPMVYPSHYGRGEYGIAKPDLNPYGIIYGSINDALTRISGDGGAAEIRPYLQDFTATWLGKGSYQTYGPIAVGDQIRACYDLGIESFTLWDPSNNYCYSALDNILTNKSGE